MWKVVLFTALFEGSKHENPRSIFEIQNPYLHTKCYFWDPFSKSKIHFCMPNAKSEIHFPDPKSVPTSNFWCQNPHFASGFGQNPNFESEIHFWDPDFEVTSKMLNPKSKIHIQMNTTQRSLRSSMGYGSSDPFVWSSNVLIRGMQCNVTITSLVLQQCNAKKSSN